MNAYEKIEKLDKKDFKLITGVTREVFYEMLEVLKRKYIRPVLKPENAKIFQSFFALEVSIFFPQYGDLANEIC